MNAATKPFKIGDEVFVTFKGVPVAGKIVGIKYHMTNRDRVPSTHYLVHIPLWDSVQIVPPMYLSHCEDKFKHGEDVVTPKANKIVKEFSDKNDETAALKKDLAELKSRVEAVGKLLDNISLPQMSEYGTGYITGVQEALSILNKK